LRAHAVRGDIEHATDLRDATEPLRDGEPRGVGVEVNHPLRIEVYLLPLDHPDRLVAVERLMRGAPNLSTEYGFRVGRILPCRTPYELAVPGEVDARQHDDADAGVVGHVAVEHVVAGNREGDHTRAGAGGLRCVVDAELDNVVGLPGAREVHAVGDGVVPRLERALAHDEHGRVEHR